MHRDERAAGAAAGQAARPDSAHGGTHGEADGAAHGTAAEAAVPAGFRRLGLVPNPYIDMVGPLYAARRDDRFVLGLRVERRHCSPSGACHGGMLLTLADMLLVVGANYETGIGRFMSTVNVTADFIAPVPEGSWLEGRVDVLRSTRNLIFCQGTLGTAAGIALRVSGIVKPIGDPDPRLLVAAQLEG